MTAKKKAAQAAGGSNPPPGAGGADYRADYQAAVDAAKAAITAVRTYRDGRVLLTYKEKARAKERLGKYFDEQATKPMPSISASTGASTQVRGKLNDIQLNCMVQDMVRAINFARLGYAEGSIARHTGTGATARRYYSDKLGRLQWLVLEAPTDAPIEVDATPDLPGGDGLGGRWEIVHVAQWEWEAPA